MAKRVMARVPDDVAEKIEKWSERLGVSQSQLMGMAIQAGLDSIIRAVSPADSLTSDQWATLFKAFVAQDIVPGKTDFDAASVGYNESKSK